jgi:hypothetical protein
VWWQVWLLGVVWVRAWGRPSRQRRRGAGQRARQGAGRLQDGAGQRGWEAAVERDVELLQVGGAS